MRGVEFDDAKPSLVRAAGGIHKRIGHPRDAVQRQLLRHRIRLGKGHGTGRQHIGPSTIGDRNRAVSAPGAIGARLASRVRQLHARDTTLLVDEADDARQEVDVIVFPDAQVLRTDAALGRHRRRLG